MARQALADVEARHRDIVKLEKDIIELQGMFVDFAALIEDQVKLTNINKPINPQIINPSLSLFQKGQMINRIEDNVVKVDVAVDEGYKELPQAVENQRKARKVICILNLTLTL
jgi:t-SNARE complex subunit (syntaxin)